MANRAIPTGVITHARGGQYALEHEVHAHLLRGDGVVEAMPGWAAAWTPTVVQVHSHARAWEWWVWLAVRDVTRCRC